MAQRDQKQNQTSLVDYVVHTGAAWLSRQMGILQSGYRAKFQLPLPDPDAVRGPCWQNQTPQYIGLPQSLSLLICVLCT